MNQTGQARIFQKVLIQLAVSDTFAPKQPPFIEFDGFAGSVGCVGGLARRCARTTPCRYSLLLN